MSKTLKCLRCDSEMTLGRLANAETVYPYQWLLSDPEIDARTGFQQMLLRGEALERFKAARERVRRSATPIQAYRCFNCGYVELHAPPNLGGNA